MVVVVQELQSFYHFAEERLRTGGTNQTLDELYLEWRACNPGQVELDRNVMALRAALRDMDEGETGRPIEDFSAEFRQRNGI
jgi:hypothetical protein